LVKRDGGKMICAGKSVEIRSIGIPYEDAREEFQRETCGWMMDDDGFALTYVFTTYAVGKRNQKMVLLIWRGSQT
jgi:hypothetical protein